MFFTAFLELLDSLPYAAAAHGAFQRMAAFDALPVLLEADLFGIETREAHNIFKERERQAKNQVKQVVLNALGGQYTSQSGYVLNTLEAAVYHAQAETWQECVEPAVMAGEDSDTVACIVGAIAGARGLVMPEHLLEPLRLGHTWQGWERSWLCQEHYLRVIESAYQGQYQGQYQD